MSAQEQFAWPEPETGADSVAAGKKRSRPLTAEGDSRNRGAGYEVAQAENVSVRQRPVDGAPADRRPPLQDPLLREYVPDRAVWSTRVVRLESLFSGLGAAWSALLKECEDANVFLSHEWLHSWWCAYRPNAELAIIVVEDRGRLRGIAPLMIESVRRGGVSARILRFIGDGSGETDHISFLAARPDRAEVLRAVLDAIATLPWDVAQFNQMPADAANTGELLAWIDRTGLPSSITVTPCPVRRLPSSFDALLSTLPGRLRTSLRSSRKKLQQKHRVEFGLHEREDELASALEALFANHASRWQGKGQVGAFENPKRRDFYERLTPRLLNRGWLRFFYLKLDGRPVAQQYCFAMGDTVMLLQEGFDFSHAQDNVGNVLRANVFEHLIQSGAVAYDFLAGTSRHKQSWSDVHVNDVRIACARRSWRGWLFFSLPLLVERAKDRLRPWRDRLLAIGRKTGGPTGDAA